MKIQIFRTPHKFLENPTKVGTCLTFAENTEIDNCECVKPKDLFKRISKSVTSIQLGNFRFSCINCNNSCAIEVPVRIGSANPIVNCKCCR